MLVGAEGGQKIVGKSSFCKENFQNVAIDGATNTF
jgi:hypothetical protein